MAKQQLVFMACPAFVGRVRSDTVCDFFLTKTDYGEEDAITVDLRKNPLDAAWDDVQVDASVSADPPGLTSIGPSFHGGAHKGVVYLEMGLYSRLRAQGKLGQWPPIEDQPYQYQSVVRRTPAGTFDRFHGFAAEVLDVSGRIAQIGLAAVGSSTPQRRFWIDLTDPTMCDPPAGELTTVVPVLGSKGALFLSWSAIVAIDGHVPKLPPGDGSGTLPSAEDR